MIANLRLFKPAQVTNNIKRHFFHLNFNDKGLDHINLSNILRSHNVVSKIPVYFSEKEPPIIGYRFNKSIASILFNYKQTLTEEALESVDIDNFNCDCSNSIFKNDHYGHIITGDLSIVRNEALRNIIKKGPKYRLPKKINWKKDKNIIMNFLDSFIVKWIEKEKKSGHDRSLNKDVLLTWKNEVMKMVDEKIESGKRKYSKSWSLKIEGNIREELDRLKNIYVLTPTDKAQNNILFTCKGFYIKKIKEELTRPGQNTYQLDNSNIETINNRIVRFSEIRNIKISNEMKELPVIYWIPKMHKNPVGSRFIAGSKYCSIKPISKLFSKALKLILNHLKLYSKTVFERSNLNYFWILENSLEFMDEIGSKKLEHMETYDFSTLYTNLPHEEIKKKFSRIFKKVFEREARPFINVNNFKAYFSSSKNKNFFSFRFSDMMEILTFILDNIYVKFGNKIFKQVIGIPIGLDSGQDIANLLLFSYESDYVERISKRDIRLARNFNSCFRYIDDLFVGDFPNFRNHIYKIYPRKLEVTSALDDRRKVAYFGDVKCFLFHN